MGALAEENRLGIFRLLIQAGREGMAAGQVAEKLRPTEPDPLFLRWQESTISADGSELTIEQLIFPLYRPSHLVLFRVGAHDINVVLGWLPMTDRSLHMAVAGPVWGGILGYRRKHNGGRRREYDH